MTVKRGETWLVDLNPTRGSGQACVRPVLIFQHELVSRLSATFLAIPLTTNIRRASLPTCVRISRGEGGLASDSVALCHQLWVLDKTRLQRRLGIVGTEALSTIESVMLFTLGSIP
jgi:mRNA interferase MazF